MLKWLSKAILTICIETSQLGVNQALIRMPSRHLPIEPFHQSQSGFKIPLDFTCEWEVDVALG